MTLANMEVRLYDDGYQLSLWRHVTFCIRNNSEIGHIKRTVWPGFVLTQSQDQFSFLSTCDVTLRWAAITKGNDAGAKTILYVDGGGGGAG